MVSILLLTFFLWETPAGRQALDLRAALRALKVYDEMGGENWAQTEAELRAGCREFVARPSRILCKRGESVERCAQRNPPLLWRVGCAENIVADVGDIRSPAIRLPIKIYAMGVIHLLLLTPSRGAGYASASNKDERRGDG